MRRLVAIALVVLPGAALALPCAPVVMGGLALAQPATTTLTSGALVHVAASYGAQGMLGCEVGERFNHQVAFELGYATGNASAPQNEAGRQAAFEVRALTYELTYDRHGKDVGVSPYFGAAASVGWRGLTLSDGPATLVTDEPWALRGEARGVFGVRATDADGFGYRLEGYAGAASGGELFVGVLVGVTAHLEP